MRDSSDPWDYDHELATKQWVEAHGPGARPVQDIDPGQVGPSSAAVGPDSWKRLIFSCKKMRFSIQSIEHCETHAGYTLSAKHF